MEVVRGARPLLTKCPQPTSATWAARVVSVCSDHSVILLNDLTTRGVTPQTAGPRNAAGRRREERRPPWPAAMTVVPLLRNQLPMPTHKSIGRHDRLQLHRRLAPDRLSLPSQQCTLRINESDPLAAKPSVQHPTLRLEELDDDQLTSMNPARHNGQETSTVAAPIPCRWFTVGVVRVYGQYALDGNIARDCSKPRWQLDCEFATYRP
jgi:hypothetical protein